MQSMEDLVKEMRDEIAHGFYPPLKSDFLRILDALEKRSKALEEIATVALPFDGKWCKDKACKALEE